VVSYADKILEVLNEIAMAYANGDTAKVGTSTRKLIDVIAWGNTLIHLDRAAEVLSMARADSGVTIALGDLPRVPFRGALHDLLTREPRLAVLEGNVPAYMRVQEIYRNGGGFAMASQAVPVGASEAAIKAATKVTADVQSVIIEGGLHGATTREKTQAVRAVSGARRGYAENIVRTNEAMAQTNGTYTAAQHPAVRAVAPAFIYDATLDDDVRLNHRAANGMVAATDDPIWAIWKVPNGYNCRCAISLLRVDQLEQMGLWDEKTQTVTPWIPRGVRAGARPDAGFAA
jgi:SPP1 gp7 family putative phage head morphogenesis protein